MEKVTVQIKDPILEWDYITKVNHTFKNWKEVSTFAYRLALQTGKEIRVESNGNGNYYSPLHAETYLKM